jgi:O-antigen ligase
LIASALFVLYLGAAWLAHQGIQAETDTVIERLACAFVLAVAAGAAYLLFELLTQSLIQRLLFTHVPVLRPTSPKHVGMIDGSVAILVPDELNRSVAVLNFVLWPALLIIGSRSSRSTSSWIMATLAAVAAAVTFLSQHEASKAGLFCAAIIFLLGFSKLRWSRYLVVAGWLAAVTTVVPAAHLAYRADLHTVEWLPVNARARVIIWAATAEEISRQPLLGVGAAGSRWLHERQPGEERPDHVIRWRTGVHAHNVYLQTWYELGVVGAALLLFLGLAMIAWIGRLPSRPQAYAFSTFISVAVIAAFSWGSWQPWFMATLFLVPVLLQLSIRVADATHGHCVEQKA